MAFEAASRAKEVGLLGFEYNRGNYQFDQALRFGRFTVGRKMEMAQVGMFREDVSDLANTAMSKLKIYAPIMTMSLGYCITIFVEGRSGLKFPGPPTFISGVYLQCLGVGFGFMTLSTWLCFHAALRAQVAATQLRTRKIRLPVPTQQQLDNARQVLSTFEEQSLYDTFRLPFVMPNGHASGKDGASPAKPEISTGSKKKVRKSTSRKPLQIPGFTAGHPRWIKNEADARNDGFTAVLPSSGSNAALPHGTRSTKSLDGAAQSFEHFEYMREAQKEWWGSEAYTRVCFLFGMMHFLHSFAYWLVIHNIAELGMVWCANIAAAGLTASVWLIFRLDVLPEYGGCFPIEASGPFVSAITLALMYTGHYSEVAIDVSRAMAMLVIVMQILWTFRLYAIAMPSGKAPSHHSKEAGGRLFNEEGSMEVPSWLPAAFQHVTYLIAPAKTQAQLDSERELRDANGGADPMTNVDMTPWRYTRIMLVMTIVGWLVLLAGRAVECVTGERMLLTSPGQAPWTRTGQWYGWEHGPVSSKHYAHVTPQIGHFGWQRGWGPQGQQELWASDLFGFHPEADAHWAEDSGPDPIVGAAGIGENTWAQGILAYGTNEARHPSGHFGHVDDSTTGNNGGHARRLRSTRLVATEAVRPLVPAAVKWPANLEPELLACGTGSTAGQVLALTSSGFGALLPADVVEGSRAGAASNFTLGGILSLGMARGVNWIDAYVYIITGSGWILTCPLSGVSATTSQCSPLPLPSLPIDEGSAAQATLINFREGSPVRAAMVTARRSISLLEVVGLAPTAWQQVGTLRLPDDSAAEAELPEVVGLTASSDYLLATTKDGAVYRWHLRQGLPVLPPMREIPTTPSGRTWWSGCSLPSGRILRLASAWKRTAKGTLAWQPDLLL